MSGEFLRNGLRFDLLVRQQPKQARMCGVGGKADRRPIDPPPIVQLKVTSTDGTSGLPPLQQQKDNKDPSSNFLQNPYYFMFASLASPDSDDELHLLKDGKTRYTTGSVVSSLYHLKDHENGGKDAGFFVFPDLSVRTEGSYRLKLSLFEVVGANVHHCKSIFSKPFYVYTAKKFPGMEESTQLSCSLADQGIKIRIRKDIRVRKRPVQIQEIPQPDDQQDIQPDEEDASPPSAPAPPDPTPRPPSPSRRNPQPVPDDRRPTNSPTTAGSKRPRDESSNPSPSSVPSGRNPPRPPPPSTSAPTAPRDAKRPRVEGYAGPPPAAASNASTPVQPTGPPAPPAGPPPTQPSYGHYPPSGPPPPGPPYPQPSQQPHPHAPPAHNYPPPPPPPQVQPQHPPPPYHQPPPQHYPPQDPSYNTQAPAAPVPYQPPQQYQPQPGVAPNYGYGDYRQPHPPHPPQQPPQSQPAHYQPAHYPPPNHHHQYNHPPAQSGTYPPPPQQPSGYAGGPQPVQSQPAGYHPPPPPNHWQQQPPPPAHHSGVAQQQQPVQQGGYYPPNRPSSRVGYDGSSYGDPNAAYPNMGGTAGQQPYSAGGAAPASSSSAYMNVAGAGSPTAASTNPGAAYNSSVPASGVAGRERTGSGATSTQQQIGPGARIPPNVTGTGYPAPNGSGMGYASSSSSSAYNPSSSASPAYGSSSASSAYPPPTASSSSSLAPWQSGVNSSGSNVGTSTSTANSGFTQDSYVRRSSPPPANQGYGSNSAYPSGGYGASAPSNTAYGPGYGQYGSTQPPPQNASTYPPQQQPQQQASYQPTSASAYGQPASSSTQRTSASGSWSGGSGGYAPAPSASAPQQPSPVVDERGDRRASGMVYGQGGDEATRRQSTATGAEKIHLPPLGGASSSGPSGYSPPKVGYAYGGGNARDSYHHQPHHQPPPLGHHQSQYGPPQPSSSYHSTHGVAGGPRTPAIGPNGMGRRDVAGGGNPVGGVNGGSGGKRNPLSIGSIISDEG